MGKILGLIYFDFFSALKHIVWACHPRIDIASLQHSNRTVCNSDHFRRVCKFKICHYCTNSFYIHLLSNLTLNRLNGLKMVMSSLVPG